MGRKNGINTEYPKYSFTMTIKYVLLLTIVFAILSCEKTSKHKTKTSGLVKTQSSTKNQASEISSTIKMAGVYSFGDDPEKGPLGSVTIYPLSDSSVIFYLDICRGAPSYNLGQLLGQMTVRNDSGIYELNDHEFVDCRLNFRFTSEELKITTDAEHDDCGFGFHVYADNNYRHIDKSIPKYFINGRGDTILFKGLVVENYEY